MIEIVLSPKYQIVIPKVIREQIPLRSGQKVEMVLKDGIINLIPSRPLEELRGFIKKKIRVKDIREHKDRV